MTRRSKSGDNCKEKAGSETQLLGTMRDGVDKHERAVQYFRRAQMGRR
jgi:hypothetical protein